MLMPRTLLSSLLYVGAAMKRHQGSSCPKWQGCTCRKRHGPWVMFVLCGSLAGVTSGLLAFHIKGHLSWQAQQSWKLVFIVNSSEAWGNRTSAEVTHLRRWARIGARILFPIH